MIKLVLVLSVFVTQIDFAKAAVTINDPVGDCEVWTVADRSRCSVICDSVSCSGTKCSASLDEKSGECDGIIIRGDNPLGNGHDQVGRPQRADQ